MSNSLHLAFCGAPVFCPKSLSRSSFSNRRRPTTASPASSRSSITVTRLWSASLLPPSRSENAGVSVDVPVVFETADSQEFELEQGCAEAPQLAHDAAAIDVAGDTNLRMVIMGTVALLAGFSMASEAMAAPSELMASLSSLVSGPILVVSLSLGFSAFVQSLAGFGFSITCVGALTQLPWITNSSMLNVVQPVTATLGALTGWILLFPEIRKIQWRKISALLIATTVATPIGVVGVNYVDSSLIIHGLGALVTSFVLYTVLGVKLPKLVGSKAGAYGFGLLGGALGGAFDMIGPAIVIHASAADWDASNGEFRRNMLSVVTVNATLVMLVDLFAGRLNDYYYMDFVAYAIPTVLFGIVTGKLLAERLGAASFKNVVLLLCFVMGARLLVS